MRGITISLAALVTLAGATGTATAASTEWIDDGDTPLGISGDGRFVTFGHSIPTCPFCGAGYAGALHDRRNGTGFDICSSSQQEFVRDDIPRRPLRLVRDRPRAKRPATPSRTSSTGAPAPTS